MANNTWRHPSNTNVAQVWQGTVTTTTVGHTYTVTLTDDDGNTEAITFTVTATENTVALVAAAFASAWNASAIPLIAGITASSAVDVVSLTADTAGVPFTAAASGTGTWSSTGNTTENVGNNDWTTARNWEKDAIPVATDDALFDVGSVDVKYGLNQAAVALADFRVFEGCSSQFGRFDNGLEHYLRIDPNLFRYEGKGSLAMFDLNAAAIAAYVATFGSPGTAGRKAVYIKGSAITTLTVNRGIVGVAVQDADTATVTEIVCGYLTGQTSDVDLEIGSGTTLTTLTQSGGICKLKAACTTVNQSAGTTLTTEGSGAITTINARGTCKLNSSGTITTLNVWGLVDFSGDRTARTVTNLNLKPGGKVILTSDITVTTLTGLTEQGDATIEYV